MEYDNPDKRCSYPFSRDDYCWGYAGLVDKNATKSEIEEYCKGCEFFEIKGDR